MDIPTRRDIEKIVIAGDKKKHSHVIIYLDRFDYTYESRYVEKDEDIDEVIARLISQSDHSMISIIEIYNYALDLNSQLHEERAYHIEPRPPRVIVSQTEKAKEFATLMHQGQLRKDGSEYINHPTRVAEYVRRYKQSKSIDILEASGYLHDTVEDTGTTYYDLVDNFGPLIAHIVMELTTDEDMKEALGKTRYLTLKMKT